MPKSWRVVNGADGEVSTAISASTSEPHETSTAQVGNVQTRHSRSDVALAGAVVVVEYAIVASLLIVSAVVLVRTVVSFLGDSSGFPLSVIPAIDGILVVIILIDILHTVFRHLRDATFPVRPFLVIGILAGIRDILSSSARLTLSTNLSNRGYGQTLIELGVGVGVVVLLLLGLVALRYVGGAEDDE